MYIHLYLQIFTFPAPSMYIQADHLCSPSLLIYICRYIRTCTRVVPIDKFCCTDYKPHLCLYKATPDALANTCTTSLQVLNKGTNASGLKWEATCMYIHTCIRTYMYVHTLYIHTCTCTCIYIAIAIPGFQKVEFF